MAFTQFNMAPIVPGHSGLESIRSVAANFARTDEDDNYAEYVRIAYGSSKSEHLLQLYGQAVHDKYIVQIKAEHENAQAKKWKRQTRRESRRRRRRERCRRLQAGVKDRQPTPSATKTGNCQKLRLSLQ
ncbi:MAG: hypothetical protein Q9179_004081 [Wetmoreana sp. 5 TL-2023]